MLSVRQVKYGNTITVLLTGPLVHEQGDVAARAFGWAAEDAVLLEGESAQVVVDMDAVTQVDATGIALLASLQSRLDALPVTLVVTRTSPNVRRFMQDADGGDLFSTQGPRIDRGSPDHQP